MVNDIAEPEREDGELEEEQPLTLQQVLSTWQPAPSPSPFSAMALPSSLAKARAVLEYDVTTYGTGSPQELMAKVTLIHQENLISSGYGEGLGVQVPTQGGIGVLLVDAVSVLQRQDECMSCSGKHTAVA